MSEPITVAEAALHLRLDTSSPFVEERYVSTLITVARRYCEQYLQRSIGTQTRTLTLDAFPAGATPIVLPYPPVYSVQSVTYLDEAGALQSVTGIRLSEGRIEPAYGQTWPVARQVIGAVNIDYTAGYISGGSPDDFPLEIKQAMLLVIGDLYQNREAQFVGVSVAENKTVMALLTPYRLGMGI